MKWSSDKNMSYSELCHSKMNTLSERTEISLQLKHVYVHAPGTLDYSACGSSSNNNNNKVI